VCLFLGFTSYFEFTNLLVPCGNCRIYLNIPEYTCRDGGVACAVGKEEISCDRHSGKLFDR